MAIGTPTTLGTTSNVASATSLALTTSAAVPILGKIFLFSGWFGAGVTLSSISGGSLTWTVLNQIATAGNQHFGMGCADASNGLAISTALTANYSAAATSRYVCACYVTVAQAGTATITTVTNTGNPASPFAWTSTALTVPAYWLLIGGCYADENGINATSTPSGGNTELHDFRINSDSMMTTVYQIPNSSSSIASQGNLSNITGGGYASVAAMQPMREPHAPAVNFQDPAVFMEKRNHLWLPKRKLWRPRIEIPRPVLV